MNQDIKQRWVSALESGLYPQTKHVLRDDNGFCCLGVLCDLYLKERKKGWLAITALPADSNDEIECYTLPSSGSQCEVLPTKVAEWAGFTDDFSELDGAICPWIARNGKQVTLSDLNDQDYSFEEIAQIIKEKF